MGTAGARTKGTVAKVGGKIEKGFGKVVGSEKLETEGRAKEWEGKSREEAAKLAGRTRATAEEAGGAVKRGVGVLLGSEGLEASGAAEQKKGERRHKANE